MYKQNQDSYVERNIFKIINENSINIKWMLTWARTLKLWKYNSNKQIIR